MVNVVDISEENRLYAMQVAAATGVSIDYICSDVLNIPNEETLGEFDIVLMEFGVLHYFTDLNSIFTVVRRRLRMLNQARGPHFSSSKWHLCYYCMFFT